ncbi:MAG: choice-of-anchor Q domain-containing protein [Saprospiraceae bacterium]
MKKSLLFLFLILITSSLSAQTIYVKSNATGANNGTSWQDAYTALGTALAAANPGNAVWVAAGTYKPAGAPNAGFSMKAGVALYGGFAGNEATLAARNPVANLTTLKGDLTGDDVVGTYTTNRTDNSLHVLEVMPTANPDDRAVVDGFTISGGQTLVGDPNPDLTRRGGGILTTAKLTVRACRFTDNYAETGGALAALTAAASGLDLYNCQFDKNGTGLLSAGIYLRDLSGGSTVRRCIFSENKTIRGSLYVITSANMTVDSCSFLNNDAGTAPCAGMYTWKTTFTLTNSTFKGNRATDFAGMYNDGREGVFPFTIDNCLFEDNIALDITNSANVATGGAIFNATTTSTIKNCFFLNNAGHQAGAIYMSGYVAGNKNYIENCLFEENRAAPGASTTGARGGTLYSLRARYEVLNSTFKKGNAVASGGQIHHSDSSLFLFKGCRFEGGTSNFGGSSTNYNPGTVGTYEECAFVSNSATVSGGAVSVGFTANVTFKKCTFTSNKARSGAATFMQNTNSKVTVQDCTYSSNTAEQTGGGINISSGGTILVENSTFETNSVGVTGSSNDGVGGAMNVSDDTFNVGNILIRNSRFQFNFAKDQGAGINISNYNTDIVNCLFVANQNLNNMRAGGAIINNASGSTSPLSVVNCTFAENIAGIGAGISQWEDSVGTATLTLQNCILYGNLGKDYEIEAGTPTVTSKGGNHSGDNTLAAALTQLNDEVNADPLFEDASQFNYRLKAGSPCIDKGIALGAPTTDLGGAPRSAIPDKGCFEFQTIGTRQIGTAVLPLRLMPNPATERTVAYLDGDWAGQVQVSVTDQNGALVRAFTAFKNAGLSAIPVDLGGLPAGVYSVRVQSLEQWYEGRLMKQ